ncbi:MAG: LysR family transcriptional regulator [Variovorax sp.]
MKLHSIDLNLFPVFQAIYLTRSITLAGQRVDMTQSAVSNALKRMRERFDDPLFVRTTDGMMPTPLADGLIGPVEAAIEQLSQAADQRSHFDPGASSRVFRLALNDIGQLVMIPALLQAVRGRAPGVRFETVDASLSHGRQMMLAGQVDLAVGSWEAMGPTFFQQRLFDETFVVLMSASNPLASCRGRMSAEGYLAAEHVGYRPSGSTDLELQNALRRANIVGQRNVVLTAAHSLGLSAIVATSNLLLTAPRRLAKAMALARPDLHIAAAPFDVRPFPIRQQWHERFHQDSGNRWLRELFFSLFHETAGPPVRLDLVAAPRKQVAKSPTGAAQKVPLVSVARRSA